LNKHIRLALFLLCVAPCATRADDKAVVAIHGFDKMSCSDWLDSYGNDEVRAQYIAWIRGIVTGYNFANPDNQVAMGHMPGDFALGLFVDSYCRSHRSTSIAGAAFALIEERRGDAAVTEFKAPESDANPFQAWLKRQSDDMRSLDINIQRDIYKKQMELDSGK
jgi:hypothetical protein